MHTLFPVPFGPTMQEKSERGPIFDLYLKLLKPRIEISFTFTFRLSISAFVSTFICTTTITTTSSSSYDADPQLLLILVSNSVVNSRNAYLWRSASTPLSGFASVVFNCLRGPQGCCRLQEMAERRRTTTP